jgi:hypothetical protein
MSAVSVVEQEQAIVARKVALRGAISHIEREFGEGALMRMGDEGAQVRCDAVPTGALSLDLALGIGGVPRGRLTIVCTTAKAASGFCFASAQNATVISRHCSWDGRCCS